MRVNRRWCHLAVGWEPHIGDRLRQYYSNFFSSSSCITVQNISRIPLRTANINPWSQYMGLPVCFAGCQLWRRKNCQPVKKKQQCVIVIFCSHFSNLTRLDVRGEVYLYSNSEVVFWYTLYQCLFFNASKTHVRYPWSRSVLYCIINQQMHVYR